MSEYNSYTAIRTEDAESVADAVVAYCQKHGVPLERVPPDAEPQERNVVTVTTSGDGWTFIEWPQMFMPHHVPVAEDISAKAHAVTARQRLAPHVSEDRGAVGPLQNDEMTKIVPGAVRLSFGSDPGGLAG